MSESERKDLYLRTRYVDPRRGELREREYADDGTVWVVINGDRSLWCRFDADAVAAGRRAISEADLSSLDDIDSTGPDQATMTYEWWLGEGSGRFVDAAYPVQIPDQVDALEEALLRLEEAAEGGRSD